MQMHTIRRTCRIAAVLGVFVASCNPRNSDEAGAENDQSASIPQGEIPYWCRYDSDSSMADENANRIVIRGHPWARVGPNLYDGRNDEAATITIDSHDWRVVSTSGEVSHNRESRSFKQLKSDATTLNQILAEPEAYRNEVVVIECYWINHVEGAWLASDQNASLDSTLTLGNITTSWFLEAGGAELEDQWGLGPTRRVLVSGTLKIGDLDVGMVNYTNHPYLDVDTVIALDKKKDNQTKKPTVNSL